MISTAASGLGFIIGVIVAIILCGIGLAIVVGVLLWLLRTVFRLALDFVPGLKRWATRNDNPFRF